MGMMILRPEKQLYIPDVQVLRPRKINAASTWWDNNGAISGCVAAYAPKGAASLASSYTNLTGNATYNAAPGVAPTLNANGWVFNGTTQYLTTGVVPTNSWSMIATYSSATFSGGAAVAGMFRSSNGIVLQFFANAGNQYRFYNAGVLVAGTWLSTATIAVAGQTAYVNGSSVGSILAGSSQTVSIYIGALNNNGVSAAWVQATVNALAIYSTTLTAGEVATITTAMNAL